MTRPGGVLGCCASSVREPTTGSPAWWLALMAVLACGCGQAPAPTASFPLEPAPQEPPKTAATDSSDQPFLAEDCPPPGTATEQEIAAQSAAIVPLKPGLTLATTWHRATEGDEVECLTQVRAVDASTVDATADCGMETGTEVGSRRTCRTDLRSGYMYYTGAGDDPDVVRGATMFSLSTRAFGELKATGSTRHRFVSFLDGAIVGDLDGVLDRVSTGTLSTIVNDRMVELPVVRTSGRLRGTAMGKPVETRVTAAIVEDAAFPLVLDYALPDVGAAGFSVRYGKVSFPTDGKLEEELATAERVDIYGIYFDVDSDRIRRESEPVLRELAGALQRNPQWQVVIEGHTDSIGTARANMELSQRRSEAVRAALVDEHGIGAARLSARGHGATMPKDSNATPEGRARNRRVEVVRR